MADILQVRNEQTGEWVSIPCLQGPPGKDGVPGKNGVKGDPGEKGDKGDPGSADLVLVQSIQPTSPTCKIWVKI